MSPFSAGLQQQQQQQGNGSHEECYYSVLYSADAGGGGCATTEQTLTHQAPVTSQPHQQTTSLFTTEHLMKPCKEPDELVLIAELTSRQEIKLRIKQNDDIPGAKVSCNCQTSEQSSVGPQTRQFI